MCSVLYMSHIVDILICNSTLGYVCVRINMYTVCLLNSSLKEFTTPHLWE